MMKALMCGLALVVLAGCGSSGGGSSKHGGQGSSSINLNKGNPNPNNTPTGQVALAGKYVSIKGSQIGNITRTNNSSLVFGDVRSPGEINTLYLDGQSIPLVPAYFSGKVYRKNNKDVELSVGNNLQYARYGWYIGESGKSFSDVITNFNSALFYQGLPTDAAKMAAHKGVARYEGISLSTQTNKGYKEDYIPNVEGSASLAVDFDTKTFSASFKPYQKMLAIPTVHGNVKGNSLQSQGGAHRLEGTFFGPNGEEAAGLYSFSGLSGKVNGRNIDQGTVIGTFGVKKQ